MTKASVPVTQDLVLVGGGHSQVTVIKRFAMNPIPGVRLTIVCRDVHTPYSGMLPGFIAGHYTYDDAHIDLLPLARLAGARFLHDEVVGIDLANRRLKFRERPSLAYDVVSINTGSTPSLDVAGAEGRVVPVKPISNFLARWDQLVERVLALGRRPRIGVVGTGAGGVELALAAQFRLKQFFVEHGKASHEPEFHLYGSAPTVLGNHNGGVRSKFDRILAERGVHVHTSTRVAEVTDYGLVLGGGELHALDEVLWVTHASAPAWPGECGLDVNERGFIKVRDTLQTLSHPEVFAAGDVAAVVAHPREKAGVFAVRQGPPLEENLRRVLLCEDTVPFHPQKKFLSIISTGDKYAVASRSFWSFEGSWVWTWKDWIDRRFMDKYNKLPEMEILADVGGPEAESARMRCAGCGSKVGPAILERALARVPTLDRPDVITGLSSPDDAAIMRVPKGKVSVQSVDFFRAIVDDPYVFGRIAANHCLGDIFAMGAEAQMALAIVTLPPAADDKTEELLVQLLLGAHSILADAGAALAGGHTSEGNELGLGLAVTGLADPNRILRKRGLRPGDQLILSKPLGTGTLFAAEMRGKAKGRWITAALDVMTQSSRRAAQILIGNGATACTDVTGFGLIGHLAEMTAASQVEVEMSVARIPFLDGARETAAAGILSSLHPANLASERAIHHPERHRARPEYALLFDPQTAGGLLAGVPREFADTCLGRLRADGYAAALIGEVRASSRGPATITLA
ncbi:MAG: selenide, water dikinase SelD [Acidobacteria bacterium]|nr:selenide, water dikinase SelD [Acidobacteriota bacterium]